MVKGVSPQRSLQHLVVVAAWVCNSASGCRIWLLLKDLLRIGHVSFSCICKGIHRSWNHHWFKFLHLPICLSKVGRSKTQTKAPRAPQVQACFWSIRKLSYQTSSCVDSINSNLQAWSKHICTRMTTQGLISPRVAFQSQPSMPAEFMASLNLMCLPNSTQLTFCIFRLMYPLHSQLALTLQFPK